MNLKSLMKDTAIYGLSSIVGRFLNYLLVPLYTNVIAAESGGYGIVTNLYAYTAFFLALLTFGMETTLFRFSNKDGEDCNKVYGTALKMVGLVALVFFLLILACQQPIAAALGYGSHPEYILCMGAIVALDAFQAIMFSRLRQQRKAVKFMMLKFGFIIPNVLLNLFVFLVMPKFFGLVPALAELYHSMSEGVGLIFFVNLICTFFVTFGFGKELIKGISYGFDKDLAKRMLRYTMPLLLLSLVGILNQVADKILMPFLLPEGEGEVQLGYYGACVKIAMIMSLLTQAFRYAYEPIVFNGSRDKNSPETLSDGMKFFIIFALLAFLAVMFYMPVLRHFVGKSYWSALPVIPIVMMAEIFMGVYFNLSFWYKLSDQTHWGAIISTIGAAAMILVNVIFVPLAAKLGYAPYMACAWGGFAGYGTAMVLSWIIGQKKYPIPYDLKTIGIFTAIAMSMFAVEQAFELFDVNMWISMSAGTVMLLAYAAFAWKRLRAKR